MDKTQPRRSPLRTILAVTAPIMALGAIGLGGPAHAQPATSPVLLDVGENYTLTVNKDKQFQVKNVQEVMMSPDRTMLAISHRLGDLAVGSGSNFGLTICKIKEKACTDIVPVSSLPAGSYVQNVRWSAASHETPKGDMVGSVFFSTDSNPFKSSIYRSGLPSASKPAPKMEMITSGSLFEVIPLGEGQVYAGQLLRNNVNLTQTRIDPNLPPGQRELCTLPYADMTANITPRSQRPVLSGQQTSSLKLATLRNG